MFKIILLALLLTATSVFGQSKTQYRDYEKQKLDDLLDKSKYDSRIAPVGTAANGTEGPVIVTVNFYNRIIEYVCTKKSEWKTQLTFRQQWNDQRLKWDDRNGQVKYLTLEEIDRLWTPDTFISNSRSTVKNVDLKPNVLIRIYPNGNVLFSTRLTTTLSCPMDLKHYPFDTQTCSIQMASYGYTTDNVVLLWKEVDPIQVSKNLYINGFTLKNYSTSYCTSTTNTGEYSCIKSEFQFKRESSDYLCQWFAPTAVLTFLSFVSFWLRPNKSSRIKLLIITLVLLYLHIIYIHNKSSANVSYSTATDCWTSTCFIFVLAAFVEYGIVRIVQKLTKQTKSTADSNECKNGKSVQNCEEGDAVALKPLVDEGQDNHKDEETKEYTVNEVSNRRNYVQKWRQSSIGCRIDLLSAFLFPLLFIVFIISFFTLKSNHELDY